MRRVQECVSQRQRQLSMDYSSRPKIAKVRWGVSQTNQRIFNNIRDLLGADKPKAQELEKSQG